MLRFSTTGCAESRPSRLPPARPRWHPDPLDAPHGERVEPNYPPALDRQEQGTGLGGDLLLDALIRSVAGARHYGARALVVDAIDDRAAEFYGHHGFLPLEGRRLYRRISDIARALGV